MVHFPSEAKVFQIARFLILPVSQWHLLRDCPVCRALKQTVGRIEWGNAKGKGNMVSTSRNRSTSLGDRNTPKWDDYISAWNSGKHLFISLFTNLSIAISPCWVARHGGNAGDEVSVRRIMVGIAFPVECSRCRWRYLAGEVSRQQQKPRWHGSHSLGSLRAGAFPSFTYWLCHVGQITFLDLSFWLYKGDAYICLRGLLWEWK